MQGQDYPDRCPVALSISVDVGAVVAEHPIAFFFPLFSNLMMAMEYGWGLGIDLHPLTTQLNDHSYCEPHDAAS